MWIPLVGFDKHLADIVNRPLNRIFLACLLVFHHNSHANCTSIGLMRPFSLLLQEDNMAFGKPVK